MVQNAINQMGGMQAVQDQVNANGGMEGGGLQALMQQFMGGGGAARPSYIKPKHNEVYECKDMATLKTIISETSGVIVDFYMDRCPPCEMLKPKFAQMAASNNNDKIAFVKVNGPKCRDMYDFVKAPGEQGGFPTVVTFLFEEKKRYICGADVGAIESALGELYQMLDSKSVQHIVMKFKQFRPMNLMPVSFSSTSNADKMKTLIQKFVASTPDTCKNFDKWL